MAVVGELVVLLAGNNAPLRAALLKSEGELKGFGATATSTGQLAGLALGGIGLVAAAGMGAAVFAAAKFQEQLAVINTVAQVTPGELTKIGDSIRALSVSSGTGLNDLTKAYYDLVSAGIEPGADAINVLTLANTLAIGGLATTAQTVDLLTTAINAYGLDSKGAAVATDQFALAIKDGKVTADQIAATFANVAPLANQAGIGIDEIAASYAVLTAAGVKPAEAMTEMNRAMIELLKPGTALAALQKKLGVNFADIARDKGLVVALQQMRDAAEANGIPFQNLFGRLEGFKFALSTTGEFFGDYQAELAAMGSAGGTALDQMNERMGTLTRQLDILLAGINDLGITLGTALLPPVTAIVQQFGGAVTGVSTWAQANPGLSSSLLPVIAGVGLLGAAMAIVGAPLVLIGVAVGLAVTHMGELAAGIQVVIDKWNQLAAIPGIGLVAGIASGQSSNNAAVAGLGIGQTFRQGALNNTPVPYAGRGGGFGPPGSNATPITLQHTTNVHLDGAVIAQSVERTLYNDASTYSSGFASDERPRQ